MSELATTAVVHKRTYYRRIAAGWDRELAMTTPATNDRDDLIGQRFGRLTVKSPAPTLVFCSGSSHVQWHCICDCWSEATCTTERLKHGESKSCGCLQRELAAKRLTTHGLSGTREHRSWTSMRDRCRREKCRIYKYYGGRGITICQRWLDSFEAFLADMGPCPPGYTIERNEVNGNYEPDNCCWIPKSEQSKNRRFGGAA